MRTHRNRDNAFWRFESLAWPASYLHRGLLGSWLKQRGQGSGKAGDGGVRARMPRWVG